MEEDEPTAGQEQPEEQQEQPEKKDTKWFLIILVIIIGAFAAFFIAKYFAGMTGQATLEELHQQNLEGKETGENFVYNGYSFVKIGDMWNTQVTYRDTLFNLVMRYSPKELEDVYLDGRLDQEGFNQDYLYITFNPDDENLQYVSLAAADLSIAIAKAMNVKPIAACAKNMTDACADRPIITCENDEPTIYLQQSSKEDDAAIIFLDKCIVIKGKDFDLVKAADRFLYAWYKIMPI
jgi:hypothetical protein